MNQNIKLTLVHYRFESAYFCYYTILFINWFQTISILPILCIVLSVMDVTDKETFQVLRLVNKGKFIFLGWSIYIICFTIMTPFYIV